MLRLPWFCLNHNRLTPLQSFDAAEDDPCCLMESLSRISSLLESGTYDPVLYIIVNFTLYILTLDIARDLTLDAAQAARSSRTSSKTLQPAQIKKLLDSRNDREILDGLRKVISVCRGLCYHIQAQKNRSTTNLLPMS